MPTDKTNPFHEVYLSAKIDLSLTDRLAPLTTNPLADLITSDQTVECKPGCTYCCHLRVAAYPHEVIGIYRYLQNTFSDDELKETRQRVNNQFAMVKDLSVDERRAMNVACPLLVDDLCSAHPVRPISCAGHHSTDAWICRDAFMHPEVTEITYEHPGIPMIQSVKAEQAAQEHAIQRALKNEGDDPTKVELISSLHEIFNDPTIASQWQTDNKEST